MLTFQWLLCIQCFTSLVSFTGFYTEEEPRIVCNIYLVFSAVASSSGLHCRDSSGYRWHTAGSNLAIRYLRDEKGTGAEMLPAIVPGIVTGNAPGSWLVNPVTVPEVFANVNSAPFTLSLVLKWRMDLHFDPGGVEILPLLYMLHASKLWKRSSCSSPMTGTAPFNR